MMDDAYMSDDWRTDLTNARELSVCFAYLDKILLSLNTKQQAMFDTVEYDGEFPLGKTCPFQPSFLAWSAKLIPLVPY